MEWSFALHRAVQEHGMSQDEAGALVEAILVDIYQPVTDAFFKLSRLRSAKRETRVKWIFGMITRYFFTAPFIHRHLPSEAGVSFDVTLCPFADYYKDQGVRTTAWRAHVASSWCALKPLRTALSIATSDGNSRRTESNHKRQDSRDTIGPLLTNAAVQRADSPATESSLFA
jgi:hypothetical protein